MPSADAATVRGVVRALEPYQVQITVLPNLRDILDGVVTVNQIRRLAIEDLLPRAPVGLDEAPLRDLLVGRRVLVTGAGGSIGSELCLQIAALRPHSLVLYERNENSLYTVANLFADRGPGGRRDARCSATSPTPPGWRACSRSIARRSSSTRRRTSTCR